MKIMYYRGDSPNFGDELNLFMWPRLLPEFFDDDAKTLFIGIGSTIGDRYDKAAKKIVFGAGFVSHYANAPDVHYPDWHVYFVRGPRTARALNISADLALGDSAILLRTLIDSRQRTAETISFMPHWESLGYGNWELVCKLAGIHLIDPRRPVDEVIAELLQSKIVITEAMHGAIVTDALRIPWVPVLPINPAHRGKWHDWAGALGIDLRPHRLMPSSLREAHSAVCYRPKWGAFTGMLAASAISPALEKGMVHIAAHGLSRLAKAEPCLSSDQVINSVTARMQEKLHQLQRDYA